MNPTKIPGANRDFGAPIGWDSDKAGECSTLPVRDDGSILHSAWLPNTEERAALAAGKPVILMIWGRSHPVVAVSVEAVLPTDDVTAADLWLLIADGEGTGETKFASSDEEIVQFLWDQCGPGADQNEEECRNSWFSYLEDGDNWQSRDGYPRWRCDIEIGETGRIYIQRITHG